MAKYQSARQKLINREIVLKRKLYSLYGYEFQERFHLELMPIETKKNLLAQLCVRAASKVQEHCQLSGYNGWLYTTEEVRRRWALSFTSKGKKFQTITIIFLEIQHSRD